MSVDQYEHEFRWDSSVPQAVVVTGTFDNWQSSFHLTKEPSGKFSGKVCFPYGSKVLYKYRIDGDWRANPNEPIEYDHGFQNNVLYVPEKPPAAPTPAAASAAPETTAAKGEPSQPEAAMGDLVAAIAGAAAAAVPAAVEAVAGTDLFGSSSGKEAALATQPPVAASNAADVTVAQAEAAPHVMPHAPAPADGAGPAKIADEAQGHPESATGAVAGPVSEGDEPHAEAPARPASAQALHAPADAPAHADGAGPAAFGQVPAAREGSAAAAESGAGGVGAEAGAAATGDVASRVGLAGHDAQGRDESHDAATDAVAVEASDVVRAGEGDAAQAKAGPAKEDAGVPPASVPAESASSGEPVCAGAKEAREVEEPTSAAHASDRRSAALRPPAEPNGVLPRAEPEPQASDASTTAASSHGRVTEALAAAPALHPVDTAVAQPVPHAEPASPGTAPSTAPSTPVKARKNLLMLRRRSPSAAHSAVSDADTSSTAPCTPEGTPSRRRRSSLFHRIKEALTPGRSHKKEAGGHSRLATT